MATRLRLSESVSADVSPSFQSYTHTNTVRRRLARSDSSTLTTTAYAPDAGDHLVAGDAVITQFVSDEMAAGNIFTSGDTLKYAVQVLEAHANNNLTVQVFVSVVDAAGTSVQATLRSKNSGGTEIATSLTNRFRSTTLSGSYTTVAGDRLLVEFSATGTPSATGGTQGHNWSLRRGNSGGGGDLPENESSTGTTLNPWIEFTTTIAWNNKTVTPDTASLTLTTFAPTVTAPNNQLATPTTASLTLATFAPTVTASNHQLVTPSTTSLTLSPFAPTVTASDHQTVTPSTTSLTLTTFDPSVTIGIRVVPTTAELALSTFAPTVATTDHQTVTPTTASLSLTAFAPNVVASDHQTVTPTTTALAMTAFAPNVVASDHQLVTPTTAALALTGFSPTVIVPAAAKQLGSATVSIGGPSASGSLTPTGELPVLAGPSSAQSVSRSHTATVSHE